MNTIKRLLFIGILVFVTACSKNGSSSDDDSLPTAVDKTANLLGTGDSANDMLSNDNFDRILIEIGYVTGFRPTQSALTQLTDYLREHTRKETIEIIYKELDSPTEDELTLQEIANLETKNRTAFNSGSTLAIYIYFADAPAEGDDMEEGLVTLGAVYRNTSMVIHEVTIRKLAARSLTITNADVESVTLNHEFGHLFGLVDLGTEMVNDHQSQSENDKGEVVGDNHCNVSGCLMRSELQFGGSASAKAFQAISRKFYEAGITSACILSGNTVINLLQQNTAKGNAAAPGLDSECILDIRANGGR
jgi:hypothetical protein